MKTRPTCLPLAAGNHDMETEANRFPLTAGNQHMKPDSTAPMKGGNRVLKTRPILPL